MSQLYRFEHVKYKSLLLLLTTSLLLVGCSSNHKETCARLAAFNISTQEAYDRLGLEDLGGGLDSDGLDSNSYGHTNRSTMFCRYYEN